MRQSLDEAGRVAKAFDLRQPKLDVAVAQKREQGVILRQSPGQLYRVAHEVRPRRAAAARLRFVRVAQRHGAVVFERKLGKPIWDTVRRGRPESDRAEGVGRFAKELLLRLEFGSRREQGAIVPYAVNADLESSCNELTKDPVIDLVPALHDVERRAEAARRLHVGDSQCISEAGRGLDVMGEREGGSRSAGPKPAKSDLPVR